MKKHLSILFAATLVCAGTALAQNNGNNNTIGSHETVEHKKVVTDTGTRKTTLDHYFGKVETYKLGNNMTISTPGHPEGTKTVSLSGNNLTAHVGKDVKVGEWVSVTERTETNGHKIVTVKKSKQAARAAKSGAAAKQK